MTSECFNWIGLILSIVLKCYFPCGNQPRNLWFSVKDLSWKRQTSMGTYRNGVAYKFIDITFRMSHFRFRKSLHIL